MAELSWLYVTQAFAESWAAEEILDWALHRFDRQIAMASGFGPEGLVLIDMAARLRPDIRVFTLDTGVLFPETLATWKQFEDRFGVSVEVFDAVSPDEPWTMDRCCGGCARVIPSAARDLVMRGIPRRLRGSE